MPDVVTLKEYCDCRFKAIEDSTNLQRESMENRLVGMNEFRRTLSDQSALFIPRSESDTKLNAISERVSVVEKSIWMTAGGITILMISVQVALHFLK
jgi:hypothetical protein